MVKITTALSGNHSFTPRPVVGNLPRTISTHALPSCPIGRASLFSIACHARSVPLRRMPSSYIACSSGYRCAARSHCLTVTRLSFPSLSALATGVIARSRLSDARLSFPSLAIRLQVHCTLSISPRPALYLSIVSYLTLCALLALCLATNVVQHHIKQYVGDLAVNSWEVAKSFYFH